MKNIKTKTNETNKKASISTQTRLENLQRLQNIYKEIEYIGKQGDLTAAFKDDTKRKAIFATFTDIAHNFKGIANSNDSEVLALFSEQEKRQITGTRNVSAHGSENVAINAAIKYVKFTLVPLKTKILAFVSGKAAINKARKTKTKSRSRRRKVVFCVCFCLTLLGVVLNSIYPNSAFIGVFLIVAGVFTLIVGSFLGLGSNSKGTNALTDDGLPKNHADSNPLTDINNVNSHIAGIYQDLNILGLKS